MVAALVGTPVPDIVYDGVVNPAKLENGKLPANLGVYLKNNGPATFANLHWDTLDPKDLKASKAKVTTRSSSKCAICRSISSVEAASLSRILRPRW